MSEKPESDAGGGSNFQKIGLILAVLFYLVSIVMVYYNQTGGEVFDRNVKTITFAHWQLEDGFRKGFDEAIKRFEDYKAKQGHKVKVVQTTVPIKGYPQWYMTQLVGGCPADVIETSGSSDIKNQYFTPMSSYVGTPNPFNRGTPLEGIPWRDTFVGSLNESFDSTYAEYYTVPVFIHTFRMYVNMNLLEKATGSRKLPQTLNEWLATCDKMVKYGKKIGRPVVPIGVRGSDRGTLSQLLSYYHAQMNSDLMDKFTRFGADCSATDALQGVADGKIKKEKLLAAVEIICDIGKYFCEGFPATDLEQTKFLFFSGNVGFFPEGTWNAYSMVNNTPFEVVIADVPLIGADHKFSKYFVGRPSEQGTGVGGLFGIPKATKNFELSLEFLQFITSYEINQLTMVQNAKWLSSLKDVKYTGIMKQYEPVITLRPNTYFQLSITKRNQMKQMELLEMMIINREPDPMGVFWQKFVEEIPATMLDVAESQENEKRNLSNIETMRSCAAIGLLSAAPPNAMEKERLQLRSKINLENLVSRYSSLRGMETQSQLLLQLSKGDK